MRLLLLFIFAMIGTCSLSFANTLKAKGQAESDSAYSDVFRLEAPNKSLTKIGDKKVLLETGNENWLANPNFAAPMVSTVLPGWLKHSGVAWSLEADGTSANKVLKASIAAATYSNDDLVFYSDLITSKGDNTGKNLIGKMWIKSANAGYKLCAIVDSVTQHCTDIIADSTRYIEYKTPIFSGGGDSTEYRLGIYHKAHTAGSTQDIYHKEAYLGPTAIAMGTIQTDPVAFTPTGTHTTNATYTGTWAQIGKYLEQKVTIAYSGTNTQGALNVNLRPGLTIDTTLVDTSSFKTNVGVSGVVFDGSTSYDVSAVTNGTTNSVRIVFKRTNTSDTGAVSDPLTLGSIDSSANLPLTIVNGVTLTVTFRVPISGWTAGARVSDGYDAQDVVATVKFQAANQTINAGLQQTLAFSVVEKDTAIGFNNSTYVYTVKSDGFYRVSVSGRWVSSTTSQDKNLVITMGGANYLVDIVNNTQYSSTKGTKTVYLTAGQTIYAQGGNADGTNSIQFQGSSGWLEIEKKSGAAYMTPTASVVENWNGTAGDAIGTTSALIKFTTKDSSTGGAYNPSTGIFTAPSDGFYTATWGTQINNTTLTTSQRFTTALFKNGSFYRPGSYAWGTGSSIASTSVGAVTGIYLSRGQTLNINAVSDVATTLTGSTAFNFFSVVRTGP